MSDRIKYLKHNNTCNFKGNWNFEMGKKIYEQHVALKKLTNRRSSFRSKFKIF